MAASTDIAGNATFRELLEINRLISSSLEPGEVLAAVSQQAARLLVGDAAAIFMRDAQGLRIAAAYAVEAPAVLHVAFGIEVMREIRQVGADAGLPECVGVPLMVRGAAIGVLAVYSISPHASSAADEVLLSALADQAAIALENARVHHELELQAAAARESEERFRTALDEAPIGIALVASDGRFLRVNGALAQLLGYEPAELMQLRLQDVTHVDDVATDVALLAQLTNGEIRRYELEKRYVRKNGAIVEAVVSRSVVRRSSGAPLHFITHIADVTRARQAQRELERLRIEWRAIIAHDLRHPIQTIATARDVAEHHAKGNPAVQRRLAQIKESVRRLNRMVQDLLDFSQIEARQLTLDRSVIELSEIVSETAERVGIETPERTIDVRVTGGAAPVYIDPDRVAQILENLLSNAIKYGSAGTPILVEVARHGETVAVSVTNHGPGIAADELPGLFRRFRRVEHAALRRVPGTGLGLYIARELVEAHGGTMTVESTPGATTTFLFTLPVAASAADAPAAHP